MSIKNYSSPITVTGQVVLIINIKTKKIEGVIPFVGIDGEITEREKDYIFEGTKYCVQLDMLGNLEAELEGFGEMTHLVIVEDCTINGSTINYSADIETCVRDKKKAIRDTRW